MDVIRASALGMCFGVRDALTAARAVPDPSTVTVHGKLVHNAEVLRDLSQRGFAQTCEEQGRARCRIRCGSSSPLTGSARPSRIAFGRPGSS